MRDNASYARRRVRNTGTQIRKPRREFDCQVIQQRVIIALRRPPFGHPNSPGAVNGYYVRCSERECQYVDQNLRPCPLNAGLFGREASP
jgi:hypothetical protein